MLVSLLGCLVERGVLLVGAFLLVECHVAANGEAEGFHRLQLVPPLAAVPHPHHRFLHNILGIGPVEGDAQCQPEEFVFQRQYIGAEAEFFHPLY